MLLRFHWFIASDRLSMVDPVSALAIAAGAAQFADLAAKVSLELFQYFNKVKKAPKDSSELRDHAYQLYNILTELQSIIKDTNPRQITASMNTLNDSVVQFSKTMEDMERVVVKEGEWKKRLQWPFTEKENKIFVEKLKSYKSLFDSVLSIIQKYVHCNHLQLMR